MSNEMTLEEYNKQKKGEKKHKYGVASSREERTVWFCLCAHTTIAPDDDEKCRICNTVPEPTVFDSMREKNRAIELWLLRCAGEIKDLSFHPKFMLQRGFQIDKKRYRAIMYEADFLYRKEGNDRIIVEDVKGMKTPVFKLKMKLFLFKFAEIYDLRITK